jgi:hypothetical protein
MTALNYQPTLPGTEPSARDLRIAEGARLMFAELFPQFSTEAIPNFYYRASEIMLRNIEEGLV